MKKRGNRTAGLSSNQLAWLRGESDCGFIPYQPDDVLTELFEDHGDHSKFKWDGKYLPEPIE